MQINSISNLNTQKASFKAMDENFYRNASEKVNSFADEYIQKDEIKTPGQILLSVGIIAAKTFIAGAVAATAIATLFKGAPNKTVEVLKKASNELVEFSKKVVAEPTTKMQKVTNFVKKSAGDVEGFARKAYKKVICIGTEAIPEGATTEVIEKITKSNNARVFSNLGGAVAVASLAPAFVKKDANGDGVLDVLQKRSDALNKNFNSVDGTINSMIQLTNKTF